MAIKYSNNAKSTVVSIIGTAVHVADASSFPAISAVEDYTYVSLVAGTIGVFKAIAIDKINNVITLDTAPDTAVFNTGTRVELRLTAELLSGLIDTHEHSLGEVSGVSLSVPGPNQVLTWNGTTWTNLDSASAIGNSLDGGDATGTFDGSTSGPSSGGTGSGVTVYNTPTELALAPLVVGNLAYVISLTSIYTCTGVAWASLALSNDAPVINSITSAINDIWGTNPSTGSLYDANYPGYSDITLDVTDPDGTIPTFTVLSSNLDPSTTVTNLNNSILRLVASVDEVGKVVVVRVSDGEHYSDFTVTVTMREVPWQPPVASQWFAAGSSNTINTALTIPANVFSVSAIVVGGGGNGGTTTQGGTQGFTGGRGGCAIGTLIVTPGDVLNITVAKSGGGGQSSSIYRNGQELLSATGGQNNGGGSGAPAHFSASPPSGEYYSSTGGSLYGGWYYESFAGVNVLHMVGSYMGRFVNSSGGFDQQNSAFTVMDTDPLYAGGHGGWTVSASAQSNNSTFVGGSGDNGVVRIIWGYTDSTNLTLRSFPSTGTGNY